jgi:hypothetical protein
MTFAIDSALPAIKKRGVKTISDGDYKSPSVLYECRANYLLANVSVRMFSFPINVLFIM